LGIDFGAKLSVIGYSALGDIPPPVGEVRFGRFALPTFIFVEAFGDVKLAIVHLVTLGGPTAASPPSETPPQSLLPTASSFACSLSARVRERLLSYWHRSGGSEEPHYRILYYDTP